MARIRAAATTRGRTVTIDGELRAADLQRLERACGPALERRTLDLALVLHGVVADSAARAYLERLLERGAILRE